MPQDLVQLYPLDGRLVTLRTTEDNSSTRVLLQLRQHGTAGVVTELRAQDVQLLAGVMLEWLADSGQPLPDAPAGWVIVEQDNLLTPEDEDEPDSRGLPDVSAVQRLTAEQLDDLRHGAGPATPQHTRG